MQSPRWNKQIEILRSIRVYRQGMIASIGSDLLGFERYLRASNLNLDRLVRTNIAIGNTNKMEPPAESIGPHV